MNWQNIWIASPARSDQPPIRQLQTVADLLETPALARLYAHLLREAPVTVADIVETLAIPQGTAYVLRPETRDRWPGGNGP